VADESTILAFRHLLEEKKLAKKVFKVVNQCLEDHGLLLRKGTAVAATIISASGSTKNKGRGGDLEMHSSRKRDQWFYGVPPEYGMKAHIGVDRDSSLSQSVVSTAGTVHDLTSVSELLHGEEDVVYGDAGYQGLERRREMKSKRVECRIGMRLGRRRKPSASPGDQPGEWCERAKVKYAFRIMKQQFRCQKIRLRGIDKNHSKVLILAFLTNLFIVRNQPSSMKIA